jgi:sulfoxide reductase heme-binding subunit YedZ
MGQLAFVCLLLLAITSTAGWVRRLKKNWTRLHRLVYVAGAAAVTHFIWIQKSDISEPLQWAAWLTGLLLFRIGWAIYKRRKPVQRTVTA